MRRAVRVIVSGRVQGVGYRAFVVDQARSLGFDGWVRNRKDGTVEAVFEGEAAVIERLTLALHAGPPGSGVINVRSLEHDGEV